MNSFFHISIRLKYLFLFIIILLFTGISGIAFLHTENSISRFRALEKRFETATSPAHTIDSRLIAFFSSMDKDSAAIMQHDPDSLEMLFSTLSSGLGSACDALASLGDAAVISATDSLINLSAKWKAAALDVIYSGNDGSVSTSYSALHRYVDQFNRIADRVQEDLNTLLVSERASLKNSLVMIVLISISIVLLVVILIALYTNRNIYRLLNFIRVLEKGAQPEPLSIESSDEYQEIAERLNNFLRLQQQKLEFMRTIGRSTEFDTYQPEPDDVLGRELSIMAERLIMLREEEKERTESDRKSRWVSEGIARFAEILRSERENMTELSFLIVQQIVSYLGIQMGSLFITAEDESGEQVLESVAAYAYDRRKYLDHTLRMGEGLPGTCALEKEKIYIDDIPEDYSDIISGVGQTKPRYVLLVPLKIDQQIFGVLELASIKKLEDHELGFVDQLADSIATTLSAVKSNERTAQLLSQSREQAELLKKQEEEMRNNLLALEKAHDESRKKESEISGIVNAMNQSSLVAEFDMDGRFININLRFLELLGSPGEQVMGKHHNEFAVVDKYSDGYRSVWTALREGDTVTREDRFRLYSGKELWLQQTFSPIFNEEKQVYKILLIAIDITRSRQQQENLEKQAAEITRKSLEMQSLNEAVNRSIIKCELDHDGIILDVNASFTEITGYSRKELVGRNNRLFLKDVEKEQFEKIWEEVMKDKTYEGAIRRTRPTGEQAWLMASFSPVKDEAGVIYKIYFLALDMTEKKLKYQLLEDANREIDRLKELLKKYEG